MIQWPPSWLVRRRMRAFQNWLNDNPDIKAKNEQIARDLAATGHGSLTVEEATENLRRALRTPSDRPG